MSEKNTLVDRLEQVDIGSITPYHDNPRIGDVDVIAESLERNKQYKPLVVQESTGEVLAGNHTLKAAQKLGWDTITIVRIDVSDEEAARIVVVDNRSADLGSYDAGALARILDGLPDVGGTGYTGADMQMLIDSVMVDTPEAHIAIAEVIAPPQTVVVRSQEQLQVEERREEATSGGSVGGVQRPDLSQDDEGLQRFDDHSGELRGALQLREDMMWDSDNEWGFPNYRDDMLVTEDDIPNLKTWVSQNLTPDDGTSHYLYTYNLGSSVGIPYDRTVIGFYTYDDKFEQWWMMPANYTSKAINAGVRYMVVPDFSIFPGPSAEKWIESGLPPIVNAMNVYRGRWMGRFFQESGLKIIPNLITSWPEHRNWCKYALHPQNMPVAITEAQTFDSNLAYDRYNYQNKFEQIFEYANPGVLYVYTGNPGREFCQRIVEKTKPATEVRYLDTYSTVKNKHKKLRDQDNKLQGKSGLFTSGQSRLDESKLQELQGEDLSDVVRSSDVKYGELSDEDLDIEQKTD